MEAATNTHTNVIQLLKSPLVFCSSLLFHFMKQILHLMGNGNIRLTVASALAIFTLFSFDMIAPESLSGCASLALYLDLFLAFMMWQESYQSHFILKAQSCFTCFFQVILIWVVFASFLCFQTFCFLVQNSKSCKTINIIRLHLYQMGAAFVRIPNITKQ